jgi:hypothetical protein
LQEPILRRYSRYRGYLMSAHTTSRVITLHALPLTQSLRVDR